MQFFEIHPFFLTILFFINATGVWILFKVIKPKIDESKQGLLTWIAWLSMFIPILGELFGIAVWFVATKDSEQLNNIFEDNFNDKVENFEGLRTEAKQDKQLFPLTTIMNTSTPEVQKEFILRIKKMNIKDKATYLNAALKNEDPEIVHYAATMINTLQEGYREKIEEGKKKLDPNDYDSYKDLIGVFQEYIESGLLSEHFKSSILHEYKQILEKSTSIFSNEHIFHYQLANIFYILGDYEVSYQLFIEMIQRFPSYYGGYFGAIKNLYEKKQWKEIKFIIDDMDKYVKKESIPINFKQSIKALEGNTL